MTIGKATYLINKEHLQNKIIFHYTNAFFFLQRRVINVNHGGIGSRTNREIEV